METFSIQQVINNYLKKEMEKRKDKKTEHFHASSLGSCMRKQIYKRTNTPVSNPIQERTLRIFAVGDLFHNFFQEKLKETGILVAEEETIVNKKYNYKGRFDAVVEKDGVRLLYDFKTVNSGAYHYKRDFPYKHHKMQLGSYMLFGEKEYGKMDEGRLLYISKNDMCLKEYPVILTEELKNEIIEELKKLNWCFKNKKLPERLPLKEDGKLQWQCNYCEYQDRCLKKNKKGGGKK